MSDKDWTRQLRDRMDGYVTTPPERVWESIDKALDSRIAARRRSRVVALRRWAAAAAVALLLAGAGGVYMARRAPQDAMAVNETEQNAPRQVRQRVPESGNVALANDKPMLYASQSIGLRPVKHRFTTRKGHVYKTEIQSVDNQTVAEAPSKDTSSVCETLVLETGERLAGGRKRAVYGEVKPRLHAANKRSGRLSAALATSNVMMANATSGRSSSPVYIASAAEGMFAASPDGMLVATDPNISDVNKAEKADHKMPVSVGVTVRYGITERLSVETGLIYTWLKSDFRYGGIRSSYTEEQTLHYVGVPLSVQYRVWQWKGLSAYVAAGGQVDKNIKAVRESDIGEERMEKDRLQWSAGASAGVQYDLARQIGVYVEPGVRYYFNNHSTVDNIYKDHPWNVNLQLGVRVSIR